MSTNIRAELSKNNPYYIPKERYYELKHFCRQYPGWLYLIRTFAIECKAKNLDIPVDGGDISDPTYEYAEKLVSLRKHVELIQDTVRKTDISISEYLIRAVTEGCSYEYLRTKLNMPCGREYFYDKYHKFFWLLSKVRN